MGSVEGTEMIDWPFVALLAVALACLALFAEAEA